MVPNFFVCVSEEEERGKEKKKKKKKKKKEEEEEAALVREEKRKRKREGEEEGGKEKKGMTTASLIKKDPHIADIVNKTESYRILRGRMNGLGYSPNARLMPYLELAGFGSAALIRTFDLRYDLISSLVQRWRPETHTFHLPCGKCTVTLEDVALQLGLPIDGSPVTGISAIAEPATLCYSLLGPSPGDDESNFSGLKFTWLKTNFEHLPDNATEEELMCAARAYIMHIIRGVLMPDAKNNRVHLMYLPLLTDLHNVHSYSWGSAVLVMLYRKLCRTTKSHAADIGGCLILLQSWALYRMSFLASVSHQPYVYPLVNIWSIYPGIKRSYTVPIYRLLIEQHVGEGFIWMPYRRPETVAVIPSSAYIHSQLWCNNAPIINFNVVEWYHGDRALRQFGYIQYIPDPPKEVGKIDMSSDLQPSPEYMQWYFSMRKPYLLGAQSTVVPPHVQRPGAYEPVADIEPDPHPDLEPEQDVEPEAQPEAESKGGYHYGFDIFGSSSSQHSISFSLYRPQYSTSLGPYPPQYSTPLEMYPLQHGTPPGSSSAMPFEQYDFSSMYQTPSLATEEDVGRRNHPQREHRPPNRYTPRTTPSNHQLYGFIGF
ncbi:hypothetical protein CXB51_020428 [Gossypium anomalum]|uniref:Aminotransferase-like plant mobile domain-containing protein n=1 Tax=Gossypium anomalum TaxID=47600 RepID=A0A8J6CXC3_9ROSI|nr:hypothetical protein CXB51_020428 [Gossypium anomalum]